MSLSDLNLEFISCSSFFKGKQTRSVKCRRKDDGSVVRDAVCEKGNKKPVKDLEKTCNTQACPAEYVYYNFSL